MNAKSLKSVVLDGHTANPGDLDWSPIAGLGECTVYPRTSAEQTSERIQGGRSGLGVRERSSVGESRIFCAPRTRFLLFAIKLARKYSPTY
jgi:hypothetical protein